MPKLTIPILALALGAATAMALVSCGGGSDEGLLPGNTASEIVTNLDSVDQLAASGDCSGANSAAATVHAQIDDLGSEVDPQLREALVKGAARLESLTLDPSACVEATTETTTTTTEEPTTTEPTDTETTDTETTETETTPTETTTETAPTQPTTPTQPPTGGTSGSGGTGADRSK